MSSSFGLDEALYTSRQNEKDVNPNPKIFKIIDLIQEGPFVCAEIQYPNCTNYEGTKIIVFKDTTIEEVESMTIIDPHFLKDNKVFARFEPTAEGKLAAIACCVNYPIH